MVSTNNTFEPVRYADGLYYIGTNSSPSWILESSDGLIMIDTAMPADLEFLLNNIKSLGYDFHDIRHIIHSHGHIDHIGCTRALVDLTGARTYIGKGDEDCVAGRNQLQWTNEFHMKYEGAFEADVIIHDSDEIIIGNRRFKFLASPGHTRGVLTFFFNVSEKGREYKAGMFGGAGLSSMALEYLNRYGLPTSLRDDFLHSIDRALKESVDIHLGNHLGDNDHRLKVLQMSESNNPFLDGSTWPAFLEKRRAEAIEFFKEH